MLIKLLTFLKVNDIINLVLTYVKDNRLWNLMRILMRKFFSNCIAILLTGILSLTVVGCNDEKDNTIKDESKTYILQYATEEGAHQLTVTQGQPYFLESIPSKIGYDFIGLYDAEVGGTQYVTSNGSSLSPYTDGKSIVLYPQWKAKEYTLMLDYQGAEITGKRSLKVEYGRALPELPNNLVLERSEFNGWYTKAKCQGVRVADRYGLIPDKAIVDEEIFDLSNKNGFIYLYAGFESEKYLVTFCYESGMNTEEVKVTYNTSISEVLPTTRVNGNAVLTWSKTRGGEVWDGKVTNDMVLYAKEYAPVIDLDSNGGAFIKPVVARAGSTISLPLPTKDNYKFVGWYDIDGFAFESVIMPKSSINLTAKWQAIITFDVNGGTDVSDISVPAGEIITLPSTVKDGYIFAGWYTADKNLYSSDLMPSKSITLKAGYYMAIEANISVWDGRNTYYKYNGYSYPTSSGETCFTINYNDKIAVEEGNVEITFSFKIAAGKNINNVILNCYSGKLADSQKLLYTQNYTDVPTPGKLPSSYKQYSFTGIFEANKTCFLCIYSPEGQVSNKEDNVVLLSKLSYVVKYANSSKLYL